jgi:hypothetical protein
MNASLINNFDKVGNISTVDINQLNIAVRDFLYEGDITLTVPQAIELLDLDDPMSNNNRSKRAAYRDRFYPLTLWPSPVPFTIDSSIGKTELFIKKSIPQIR